MDEWHIGDPVDWGDGFMDAQNWGHGYGGDESQNRDCGYDDNRRYSPPSFTKSELLLHARSFKNAYKLCMENARKSERDDEAVVHYKRAVDYGISYLEALKKDNLTDESFPTNKQDLLPANDLARCRQMYIKFKRKWGGLFQKSHPRKNDLEEIFEKTGNSIMR